MKNKTKFIKLTNGIMTGILTVSTVTTLNLSSTYKIAKADDTNVTHNTNFEKASPDDKARLSKVAVSLSKIEDYALAKEDLKLEYSNIRKTVLELIKSDETTKEQIEAKILEVTQVKNRLLLSIEKAKSPVPTLDSLTVNILKNDKAVANNIITLNVLRDISYNVDRRLVTNENGIVEINNLLPNSKYEIRVSNRNLKFDRDFIRFTTDENGKINSLDDKDVTKDTISTITFKASEKNTETIQKFNVPFKVIDKDSGEVLSGVELTANVLNPLSSYKNVVSDDNGNANFELEGQVGGKIYTVCIAKNAQFLYDFEPKEITISVDDKGHITTQDSVEKIFKVTKNDRRNLLEELKNKIVEAETVIEKEKSNLNKIELVKALGIIVEKAKEELSKETIPVYVQGYISQLSEKIKELSSSEEILNIENIMISLSGKPLMESLTFEIVEKDRPTQVLKEVNSEFSMLSNIELDKNKEYIIRLKENSNYTVKPINFKFATVDDIQVPVDTRTGEVIYQIDIDEKIANQEIIFIRPTEFSLDSDTNVATTSVFGNNLTDDIEILVKEITSNGEIDSKNVTLASINGTNKKKNIDFNVNNDSFEIKEYKVYLGYSQIDTSTDKFITIVKQANSNENLKQEMTINEFSSMSNGRKISARGAIVNVDVVGTFLDKEKVSIEILKNGIVDNSVNYELNTNTAADKKLTYTLRFLDNNENKENIYTAKLKLDGKEVNGVKDLTFTMKAKVNDNVILGEINPISATYSENRDKVILTFAETISKVDDNLLEKISVAKGIRGNAKDLDYKNLSSSDLVGVSGNKITILLSTPLDENAPYYNIKLANSTIKNNDNIQNNQNVIMLTPTPKVASPKITDYIIKKPILKGSGEVEVEILGENLKLGDSGTRIRVLDVETLKEDKDITKSISYTLDGGKITAKIPLLENKTDKTKSYSLVFYSHLQTEFVKDRIDGKPIISVLPNNVNKDSVTVSNISIGSYLTGASGLIQDGLDRKHTTVSKNDVSKKTEVKIYGTNLSEDLTKVRIFDDNGVEWTIFTSGSDVSGTTISMILPNTKGKGTGIIGGGNYQLLEIILPNNLSKDTTFTYYISVDGSGDLITSQVVRATVETSFASSQKENLDKRTIAIKYVDEKGIEIKENKKIFGYSWFKYNIETPEIENYNYINSNLELSGLFGNEDKEITLIYKKLNNNINNEDFEKYIINKENQNKDILFINRNKASDEVIEKNKELPFEESSIKKEDSSKKVLPKTSVKNSKAKNKSLAILSVSFVCLSLIYLKRKLKNIL